MNDSSILNYILYLIPFILLLALWVKDDINKALYAVVITELTMATSYLFFGVSPRNLFIPYAIFLGIFKYFKNPSYRRKLPTLNLLIFLTVFMYFLWAFIVQVLIHGYSVFDYKFHIYLVKSFWFISTAFLIQYFITDEKKLKKFINVILIFCGISAVVGMGQVLFGGIFIDIRGILLKYSLEWSVITFRAFGLSSYSIPFAYDMLMGAFLSFPLWMNIKCKQIHMKNWLLFSIIFGGLIFSLTKSAIGGFFIGLLIFLFFLNKKLFLSLLTMASILSILFISNINYIKRNPSFRKIMNIEYISFRKPLFKIGSRIVGNKPFGIGNGRFAEYVEENPNKFDDIPEWTRAFRHGVHNHFLMNIVYFGWIAGFLSALLIIELFAACRKIYISASSEFKKRLTLIISAFLVAYCINVFFHHAGFLKGDATIWIVAGILLSLNNMKKPSNGIYQQN